MAKDSIIILSGGMDSCTLLHEYKDNIALAITFDYGSLQNKKEQKCASEQCGKLGINISVHLVGVSLLSVIVASSVDTRHASAWLTKPQKRSTLPGSQLATS